MRTPGALHYLDRLGAPFLFLEEREVTVHASKPHAVSNTIPKVVVVLEGELSHRFEDSAAPVVLRPGSVLFHFGLGTHCYLPRENRRAGRLRVLRLTLPWGFEVGATRRGDDGGDFGAYLRDTVTHPCVVQVPVSVEWTGTLRNLRATLVSRKSDRRVKANTFARQCLLLALGSMESQHAASPKSPESPSGDLAERISRYLEAHFQEPLTLRDVARAVDRSEEHVARCYRRERGLTVFEELKRLRLRRASYLLLCSDLDVTRIGEASGFSTLALFSRTFRAQTGSSPSAFRRIGGKGMIG